MRYTVRTDGPQRTKPVASAKVDQWRERGVPPPLASVQNNKTSLTVVGIMSWNMSARVPARSHLGVYTLHMI